MNSSISHRSIRSWAVPTSMATLALVLASCTATNAPEPTPRPSAIPIPDKPAVTWNPGPPEGPWENNPWAISLRQYEFESATARNARNFSDPLFTKVSTPDEIDLWADVARIDVDNQNGYALALGPIPFTVMDIVESDDGETATVYACANLHWSIKYVDTDSTPYIIGRKIELVLGDDGNRRVTGSDVTDKYDCTNVPMAEGRFDPAPVPEPPGTYTVNDIYPSENP